MDMKLYWVQDVLTGFGALPDPSLLIEWRAHILLVLVVVCLHIFFPCAQALVSVGPILPLVLPLSVARQRGVLLLLTLRLQLFNRYVQL